LVLTSLSPIALPVAEWTQTPMLPDKRYADGSVRRRALGRFNKSVAIYNNGEPHLALGTLSGAGSREVTDYSATHPYRIGDID
jgi:hypothetical protein